MASTGRRKKRYTVKSSRIFGNRTVADAQNTSNVVVVDESQNMDTCIPLVGESQNIDTVFPIVSEFSSKTMDTPVSNSKEN